jgi:hypothetical protein
MNNKENAVAAGNEPAGFRLCESGNVEMFTEAEVNAVIARISGRRFDQAALAERRGGRCTELVCCEEG